jgi:subtilisin-like proprotein convertase family protein
MVSLKTPSQMRHLFAIIFLLMLAFQGAAQQSHNFWESIPNDQVTLPASSVKEFDPTKYLSFKLDFEALKNTLLSAPKEFAQTQQTLIISLPQANGTMESFVVRESSVMMPGLQAKHPEMRTYSGESLISKGKKMRCSITPWGFDASIRRLDYGMEYIEPIAKGQQTWYRVYDRLDFPMELRPQGKSLKMDFTETTETKEFDQTALVPAQLVTDRNPTSAPITVKIYRFACATTGQFSTDHGGTKTLVLGKLVEYTNKMNIVYEADLDIRLKLIDESEDIIFLDEVTDPYTGETCGGWMSQNPLAMQQVLGSADKYDVGHVFARFIGGDAIGVAGGNCCAQTKGRGCSSGFPPYGDGFLSIPTQEIGHQWNGGHTWNHCDANDQFSSASSCEPGSGSTIMSYAGACGTDNVSTVTDLYYQACSITEIRAFVETGIGSTCGINEITTNNPPVVTISIPQNLFVPIKTPFELNGSANDPDGDTNLSYCWDEIDLGPSRPIGDPQANSPLFRSRLPSTATNRYFPRLPTILANQIDKAEFLPTYTRDLTFRLVVRDNKTVGGGVGTAELAMKSTSLAGPFLVTSPNASSDKWIKGEYATVTWDVANTDKAPVNCDKVNIRLTTDNASSFSIMLLENAPNTGRACVFIPQNTPVTTTARVKIDGVNNVFFDLSNANFKIEAPTQANFSLCADKLISTICTPQTFTTSVSSSVVAGFAGNIALAATGLPTNAVATFSPATISAGGTSTMTIEFGATVPEGTFDVSVTGTSGAISNSRTFTFTTINNDFSGLTLQAPTDGATGVDQSPTFTWNAVMDADKYEIQVANNPSFATGTILATSNSITVGSYILPVVLEKGKSYFWRVRPINGCGEAEWKEVYSFTTLQESCQTYTNDNPISISTNGTPTIESKITILGGGVISDVNVKKIQGNHGSFKQLEARLISPQGTNVLLFKNKCGSITTTFNFSVDESATTFACPPPNSGAAVKTTESLAVFNGQNSTGEWILSVKDNEVGSGGNLNAFQLEICSASALNAPYIVNNNVLQVAQGNNVGLSTDFLKAEDANNTAAQLTFTLVTVPKYGRLQFGTELLVGGQFTQADLDNGSVRYYDYGIHSGFDDFKFIVTDGEGGVVNGKFLIEQPALVNTLTPNIDLKFELAPNPANETVRLTFASANNVKTKVRIFNMAGQLMQSLIISEVKTRDISVVDLPQGVYVVAIENELGKGVKKLVIK